MQVKPKSQILFSAIIFLFCFQLFPEPAVAIDNMSEQRKVGEEAARTLETQPSKPKSSDVLAIPGLPLKLRPGDGCAENYGNYINRRDIATYPTFKIKEICFGNPKGPDIKHDFKWFIICDHSINNSQVVWSLAPGLVLSLYPQGTAQFYGLHWRETTGRGFDEWSLIKKLPRFTIVGLKNHRTQKSKSFKWQEKVYDCANLEQIAPPGFRRVFLYDYCWFEKTTGPDILTGSF